MLSFVLTFCISVVCAVFFSLSYSVGRLPVAIENEKVLFPLLVTACVNLALTFVFGLGSFLLATIVFILIRFLFVRNEMRDYAEYNKVFEET